MRLILSVLAAVGLAALAGSHLGRWWPPGDSLAVLRLHLLVLALPVLAGLWWMDARRAAVLVALPVLLSGADTALQHHGDAQRGTGPLALYQKNLLWLGPDPLAVLEDIQAADADLITLQETSDQNNPLILPLAEAYPYHLICRGRAIGGVSIFSRFPISQPFDGCGAAPGLALVQVHPPGGEDFWLAAVHLNWPWPYSQAAQLAEVEARLADLTGPIVLAGDFNMVPWGAALRRIEAAGGIARLGGYLSTYPRFGPLVPLAIDHVMIPEGWRGTVEPRPVFGSDHRGLLATFGL